MKKKFYSKPNVRVFTFLMEDDLAASSRAAINVGDSSNPFTPKVEDFIQDNSFQSDNYYDL